MAKSQGKIHLSGIKIYHIIKEGFRPLIFLIKANVFRETRNSRFQILCHQG